MLFATVGAVILSGAMHVGIAANIPHDTGLIWVNSRGGYADAGYELGRHLKSNGISLHVLHECFSACAYAALGAKDVIGEICFHAPYDAATGEPAGVKEAESYLREMGMNEEFIMQATKRRPVNEYFCIDGKDITQHK